MQKARTNSFRKRKSFDQQPQPPLPKFYADLERARREREEAVNKEKRANLIRVKEVGPLYDPNDQNLFYDHEPLILSRGDDDKTKGLVDVVVDPRISANLTEPQEDGIRIMYDYLSGVDWNDSDSETGFILADVMGIGKTIQCIAVLWTFLTQSGTWNFEKNCQNTTIKKAIIICPASLRENWECEISAWIDPNDRKLGTEMNLLVINSKLAAKKITMEDAIEDFMTEENKQQCLIISYEGFRKMRQPDQPLAVNRDGIVGLVICDEAHILKNRKSLNHRAVFHFPVKMKIVVTGTPLQNNVMEYGSIIRYVNKDLRNRFSIQRYKTHFQDPIEDFIMEKHRQQQKQPMIEEEPPQLIELRKLVQPFFLRRTQNPLVNVKAFHHLIFCKMIPDSVEHDNVDLQKLVYNKFVEAFAAQKRQHQVNSSNKQNSRRRSEDPSSSSPRVNAFVASSFLRTLCAHPALIVPWLNKWAETDTPFFCHVKEALIERSMYPFPNGDILSAKMRVLVQLLKQIKGDPEISDSRDRVIVASCHTTILDNIQDACTAERLPFVMIRGSVSQENRKKIIEAFNSPRKTDKFIMTLSTKAGGFGINLIGANHFIMFEPDWNPHNDDQAMGRIFRRGQTKDCHFYRLLTTGSIEEAVFEKQIFKKKLAGAVLDDEAEIEVAAKEKEEPDGIFLDDGQFIPLYTESDDDSDYYFADNETENGHKEEDDEEVEAAPVTRQDNYYHLTEPIRDRRSDGSPFVSLVHDDLDCNVCKVREGIPVTDPLALVGFERSTKDELNLRDWFHRTESKDVVESTIVSEAWKMFPNDISMVMTKNPNIVEDV